MSPIPIQRLRDSRVVNIYAGFLLFIILLGTFGPMLAPYDPGEFFYDDEGRPVQIAPPSLEHPLGTNRNAQDVLSRTMSGARVTLVSGIISGTVLITIGIVIGVTAGWFGGRVDDLLMRFTDFFYGLPTIPFAIVLIALFDIGFITAVVVIGLLLWRSSARILRSQVLQIKEREYIIAARSIGGSDLHIIRKHVLPNISSMAVLLFSLGLGSAILIQAGLAFLGVINPFTPSWGIMLRNAHNSGFMAQAPWWSVTPGLLISFTVASTYMFGRKFVSRKEENELIWE